MTNPLLERNELPPFRAILPNHVVPAVDQLLTANRQEITKLLEDNVCDWDGLIAVIEALNDFLSQSFGPVSHMNSVVNTPELRDAYNASLPKLSEYQTEMGQNADLFSAYQSILTGPDFDTLDQAQKKSIENAIRDFRLSGIDLPKKKTEPVCGNI